MRQSVAELLEAVGLAAIAALLIVTFVAQSFLVQGQSMEPSLHNGERVLVEKLSYRFREPQRGEIVVFRSPGDPSRKFVKRVVGLPGDILEFRHGQVVLNGRTLVEPYAWGPTLGPEQAQVVPPGRYFVLGDNRAHSEDSRFEDVGFVPRRAIIGRALWIYWPPQRAGPVTVPATLAKDRRG